MGRIYTINKIFKKNIIVFTIIIGLFANLSMPISGLSTKSSIKLYSSAPKNDNFTDGTLTFCLSGIFHSREARREV